MLSFFLILTESLYQFTSQKHTVSDDISDWSEYELKYQPSGMANFDQIYSVAIIISSLLRYSFGLFSFFLTLGQTFRLSTFLFLLILFDFALHDVHFSELLFVCNMHFACENMIGILSHMLVVAIMCAFFLFSYLLRSVYSFHHCYDFMTRSYVHQINFINLLRFINSKTQ